MDTDQQKTANTQEASAAQRVIAPSPSLKERKAYAKAGLEILEKNMDPACWAMAVEHADGDHELARSYYARWRAEELTGHIDDTENKKEHLDDRRVSSFNRVRKMTKPEIIPAALRPAFGSLYWETLITVGLMCSFIPFVIRFGKVDPLHALVYTLCSSILVVSVLRIGTSIVFKNKSGRIYRRLAATTACILAMASLFSGAAILKSGWDQDDFRDSKIELKPKNKEQKTPVINEKKPDDRRSVVSD